MLAFIRMVYKWLEATDGNDSTARVFLFDCRKAFDLIDHRIFVTKLKQMRVPNSMINWVVDLFSERSERVKLSKD